jgi:hypothetical protein
MVANLKVEGVKVDLRTIMFHGIKPPMPPMPYLGSLPTPHFAPETRLRANGAALMSSFIHMREVNPMSLVFIFHLPSTALVSGPGDAGPRHVDGSSRGTLAL